MMRNMSELYDHLKEFNACVDTTVQFPNQTPITTGLPLHIFGNYTMIPPEHRSKSKLETGEQPLSTPSSASLKTLREYDTVEFGSPGTLLIRLPQNSATSRTPLSPGTKTYSNPSLFETELIVNDHHVIPDQCPVQEHGLLGFAVQIAHRLRDWFHGHFPPLQQQPDEERDIGFPVSDGDYPEDRPTDQPTTSLPNFTWNTKYVIATAGLGLTLVVIMLITGDRTLLMAVVKGIFCYLMGSDVARRVFGEGFCPALENGSST